jgi:signal recognition particle subunit SRP19
MTYDKFNTIYPNYIDSNKTAKLGRRIAAIDAVAEPTIQDIHEALVSLNIRHVIQPHKGYSRDATARWFNNGRVLVDLKGAAEKGVLGMGADGAFDLDDAMPDIGGDKENDVSKKKLLKQLALIIKGLPGRQKRTEEKTRQIFEEERAEKAAATAAPAPTPVITGTAGNRKKKGKKGKK